MSAPGRPPFELFSYFEAVRESDLPHPARAVATQLAIYAAREGVAYASWPTLQRITGLSRRAVARAVAQLRQEAWIVPTGETRGATGRVLEYRLQDPNGASQAPQWCLTGTPMVPHRHPEEEREERREEEHTDPPPGGPMQIPLIETTGPAEPTAPAKPAEPDPAPDWHQAMTAWIGLTQEHGGVALRRKRTSHDGRALAARLDEHGLEAVLAVFRWYWRCPDSWYGRQRVGLTTILRPSHFPRCAESALGWTRAQSAPRPTTTTRVLGRKSRGGEQ